MNEYSLTSSIFVTKIWKPPDIAKSYNLPSDGQHKLNLIVPVSPLVHFLVIAAHQFVIRSLCVHRIIWFSIYDGNCLFGCHDVLTA